MKDIPGVGDGGSLNDIQIMTEHRSSNNMHLYIPDITNYDGNGGRPRSEMMVTSVDQTIDSKKVFRNIEVPNPVGNDNAVPKAYLNSEIAKIPKLDASQFVLKAGDTVTGPLIVRKDSYPVQGDLNKVVNYETIREIFLSRKEAFPMETASNMNNNKIERISPPTAGHQAANKDYVDNNVNNKADLTKTTTQIFQSRIQIPDFQQASYTGSDVVNT